MLKRRKQGPTYERSPIQRLSEWSSRNFLILASAIGLSFLYWFAINFLVDNLFNFLSTGGNEEIEQPFSSNEDIWIITKLVGSIAIIFIIIKTKAK